MAGIYIHIPFCKQACTYCNFHFSTTAKNRAEVLSAIKNELSSRKNYLNNQSIESIYFGGGTPSVLSYQELNEIFETLHREYDLSQCKEITLEANPDDLSNEKLKELAKLPINRLSIGVQSFHEKLSLKELAELLQSIGYAPHISLDKIDPRKKNKKVNRKLAYQIGLAGFAFGNIMEVESKRYFLLLSMEFLPKV